MQFEGVCVTLETSTGYKGCHYILLTVVGVCVCVCVGLNINSLEVTIDELEHVHV